MPKNGDTFTTNIKDAHLNWGTRRYKPTRNKIQGEGYIQIPIQYARAYDIFNQNHSTSNSIYLCSSKDGFLNNVELLASGSSKAQDIYAKQFQGYGNLQIIGDWYDYMNATTQHAVKVIFTSSNTMTIELV